MAIDVEKLRPVLRAVKANEGLCGRSMIAKILRGSRDKRLLSLGLNQSPAYGELASESIERIGYLVDEALARGLIGMRDAGWHRGRHREEAHFPVLYLTRRGAEILAEAPPPAKPPVGETPEPPPSERARLLAMRAMVQGAYALEEWKHQRIEAADFVRESPGDYQVLFAMERHPGGEKLLCLYLWQQRTNRVDEVDMVPVRRVGNIQAWFERKLGEYRRRASKSG